MQEFLDTIARENTSKFVSVMKCIKEIDHDHNGYVTNQELDDIIKMIYKELESKDLKRLFRAFASIQNSILIDYKMFKKHI